ncbi:MAG: MlaD family protein [Pseudomonadota bacterium]
METRASYITVGLFVIILSAVLIWFAFQQGGYIETSERRVVEVRIKGSAAGLYPGSEVLFNGISVGQVNALDLDPADPNAVLVRMTVKKDTPIRADTKVSVSLQGVTGAAFIQLQGGSLDAPSLLSGTESTDKPPRLEATPAALNDLIERVNDIAGRTEKIMTVLESFLTDNRGSLDRTVANIETFSGALAKNADGVEKFLASVSSVGETVNSLSEKLDGTIKAAQDIASSIDPKKVAETVENVQVFTRTLRESEARIQTTLKAINDAAANLNSFSGDLQKTLGRVDGVIAKVEAEKIANVIADLEASAASAAKILGELDGKKIASTVESVEKTAGDIQKIVAAVDPKQIGQIVDSADGAIERANTIIAGIDQTKIKQAVDQIEALASQAAKIVAGVDATKVTSTIESLEKTTKSAQDVIAAVKPETVGKAVEDLGAAGTRVRSIVESVDEKVVGELLDSVRKTSDDVSKVVAALDPEKLSSTLGSIEQTAKNAENIAKTIQPEAVGTAVDDISKAANKVGKIADGVDPKSVTRLVDNAGKAAEKTADAAESATKLLDAVPSEKVQETVNNIADASKGAKKITEDVGAVTSRVAKRGADVDEIITDAKELAGRLNAASLRIDGILDKTDTLLGDVDGEGVITELRETLASFRRLANNLDTRVAGVARGINNFTNRGLQGTQDLIRNANRSINRIDRVISNIERNPQSLFSGSGRVRELSGSRVRR